jgi:hypothetical protein
MDVALSHCDDTCRCCMKGGNLISLFEETIEDIEIFKILAEIVPVQISRNDGMKKIKIMKLKSILTKISL